ncbi:MAG: M20/M25/M40 family metallo-hydrolase [Blastocatellia bacterium]
MPASILPIDRQRPETIPALLADERVRRAFAFIDDSAERFTNEITRLCEVPAPPFQEHERARFVAARFSELELENVHIDSEGNVMGFIYGRYAAPMIVVSAHLDTVFPAGTDVRVTRNGSRYCAPGIADNCAGLAGMMGMIQALQAGGIRTRGPLAFVATVGEEGEGNLRGVRHLLTEGRIAQRASAFICFEGPGVEWVTHQALGSRRYRVTLEGPGGHSWADFGVVNPVHALGRAIARLSEYPAPVDPRTTYSVGCITGGESVNVIPERAQMDIDLRSCSEIELSRLEEFLLRAVNEAVSAENTIRAATGRPLKSDVKLIGHRPSGETPVDAMIVQLALEASRTLGIRPILNRASTDANIPISLGIQSVTIGVGGMAGDCHRLSEWYEPTGRELGYKRALLLILAMAGVS